MEREDQHDKKSFSDLLTQGTSGSAFNSDIIRRSRDFEFFGVTQSRTGSPDIAKSMKLILSSGEQHIVKYHDIGCPITFDGNSKIEFTIAGTSKVTITGNGLEAVLDYIAEERLMWIKEPEDSSDLFFTEHEKKGSEIIISSVLLDVLN